MTDRYYLQRVPVRLLAVAAVLFGLWLIGDGLLGTFYTERTPTAMADHDIGVRELLLGCTVLLICAGYALVSRRPWTAAATGSGAIMCGGLWLVAEGSWAAYVVAVPTFIFTVVGIVGLLLPYRPNRAAVDR